MTGPFSSFFDLRDNPFRANPDPRYLFLTRQTRENLDQIIEGIRARKGLLLLTGEVGTGKTVLLNRLMEWLEQERIPKAFIFNSHLKASEVLELILADFGIPFNASRGTALAHLHSWLQDRNCAGQTPVLFVDEAQGLTLRTLEELRMLLNLQTGEGSLLQIVLCGQPEFEETLKRPELRQLRQRIALRCRTAPLTLAETQDYVDARLRVAGSSGAAVFQPEAVQALSHYSRGLPRVLNALCEQSLMRAASEKIRPVTGRTVCEAARELEYDEIRPFVPVPTADDSAFSGLFGYQPDFARTTELFAPAEAAALVQEAPVNSAASGVPSLEPKRLAAAAGAGQFVLASSAIVAAHTMSGESGIAAPRIPHAPIAFPSPSHHEPLSSPAANEMIARLASAPKTAPPVEPRIVARTTVPRAVAPAPVVRKEPAKPKFDFRTDWSRRYASAINQMKSVLATIALTSRVRAARAQTRVLSVSKSVSEQLSAWRDKNSNVARFDFQWSALASSCLHWLRAPSDATRRRQALAKVQRPAPQSASAARIPATQPLGSHPLPRASRSKFIRGPEKAPPVTTAILQWLQQPSHSLRERKPTHASGTRLP
jgi:general secretion pathway protein A